MGGSAKGWLEGGGEGGGEEEGGRVLQGLREREDLPAN